MQVHHVTDHGRAVFLQCSPPYRTAVIKPAGPLLKDTDCRIAQKTFCVRLRGKSSLLLACVVLTSTLFFCAWPKSYATNYTLIMAKRLLYIWLQLVHGSLNIATTTTMRPSLDRHVHIMTHKALTAAWDWVFVEIRHRPVSAQYRQLGRVFSHGSNRRS